jgi:hypothetical protein
MSGRCFPTASKHSSDSSMTCDNSSVRKPYSLPLYHSHLDLFRWHQYQGRATNDCGAYCVAIATNALHQVHQMTGAAVARSMERIAWVDPRGPHLSLSKVPGWVSLPWGMAGYLKGQGTPARWGWRGNKERLLRNLRDHLTTIVITGELLRFERRSYIGWSHAKVLFGYEPAASGERPPDPVWQPGWYFVDPGVQADGSADLPAGLLWQSEEEFLRQWRNVLGFYVEVGAGGRPS